MSWASITLASALTSMSRQGACRITGNGCISSRQCCAAASPPKKSERSLAATTCASFVLRSADVLRPSRAP